MAAATTAAAATAAATVLGIRQSRRTRYRNAEQEGPDGSHKMPRSVHDAHLVPHAAASRRKREARDAK